MSYQALYRAWRPDTFSEIVGQDAIVRTLRRQVVNGHIAHAYLFCGTRGTGKTTAAKVLSRAINCLDPRDGDPCGQCDVCRAIMQENCMDVVEIDAASNNGVDEIRDLREKIKFPPALTRYKVYIIDEVHMLSTGAFNALLKTLEEPPKHAVFILATTEPQRLPATILSRCQRFDFHRIAVDTIVERLMVVLDGIGRTATEEALYEIARAAEGAMRDALSLLDVCLSYTDGEVSAQLARDVLGTAGRAVMFDFTDALIDADPGSALRLIDGAVRRGSDPQVFIRDVTAHLRAVMLAGAVKQGLTDILEITPEDAQHFIEQASRSNADQLDRMLELFMRAEPDTRWASRPRTILELAAVRACRPDGEADASVSERLERVEKLIEKGAAAAPAQRRAASPPRAQTPEKPAQKSEPAPAPAAEPPQAYLDAIRQFAEENPALRKPLEAMRFEGFDGKTVRVGFDTRSMMLRLVLERHKAELDQVLSEAFGTPVTTVLAPEGAGRAQEKKAAPIAGGIFDQACDVFGGRDKIRLED